MLPRLLEPEVMDTPEEAVDYDAMDHRDVNRVFVEDFLAELRGVGQAFQPDAVQDAEATTSQAGKPDLRQILDAGTGTAQIPIELASRFVGRAFQPDSVQDAESAIRQAGKPDLRVVAADLAAEMLKVAERNVAAAGFTDVIELKRVDCKALPFADGTFDAVMSNSIVHHIPEPKTVIAEMWRVLKPGGVLFVRDLLRPADEATLDQLVATYAGDENAHQQKMFRDSLHAALTAEEVRGILAEVGIPAIAVRQTTDRHWTLSTVR